MQWQQPVSASVPSTPSASSPTLLLQLSTASCKSQWQPRAAPVASCHRSCTAATSASADDKATGDDDEAEAQVNADADAAPAAAAVAYATAAATESE